MLRSLYRPDIARALWKILFIKSHRNTCFIAQLLPLFSFALSSFPLFHSFSVLSFNLLLSFLLFLGCFSLEGSYLFTQKLVRKLEEIQPSLRFISPPYKHSEPDCQLKFWLYSSGPTEQRHSTIKVLRISSNHDSQKKDFSLLKRQSITDKKWSRQVIQLPPCMEDFQVINSCPCE